MIAILVNIRVDPENYQFSADVPHDARITGERVTVSSRSRISAIRSVRRPTRKAWHVRVDGDGLVAEKLE